MVHSYIHRPNTHTHSQRERETLHGDTRSGRWITTTRHLEQHPRLRRRRCRSTDAKLLVLRLAIGLSTSCRSRSLHSIPNPNLTQTHTRLAAHACSSKQNRPVSSHTIMQGRRLPIHPRLAREIQSPSQAHSSAGARHGSRSSAPIRTDIISRLSRQRYAARIQSSLAQQVPQTRTHITRTQPQMHACRCRHTQWTSNNTRTPTASAPQCTHVPIRTLHALAPSRSQCPTPAPACCTHAHPLAHRPSLGHSLTDTHTEAVRQPPGRTSRRTSHAQSGSGIPSGQPTNHTRMPTHTAIPAGIAAAHAHTHTRPCCGSIPNARRRNQSQRLPRTRQQHQPALSLPGH